MAAKPTPVQREILAIMAGEETEIDDCLDHGGLTVGENDRHLAYRTLDILEARGWVRPVAGPWELTDEGRAALASPVHPHPAAGSR